MILMLNVVGRFLCCLAALAASPGGRVVDVHGLNASGVQAAIDAAQPGDVVRLAAGVYTIDAPVRLKSNIHLVGERVSGQEPGTVLRFAGERAGVLMEVHDCDGTEVADLAFDGANNPLAEQGIVGNNSRHLLLHRLAFRDFAKGKGFGPHGIYFSGDEQLMHGVADSAIEDCTFDRIGPGAEFGSAIRLNWGCCRDRVQRNVIHDTGRGGIFAANGSTDLLIADNVVNGSQGEGLGIECWHGCDRAVIQDNRIDHWLSVDGSRNAAIRRNVVGSDDDHGPAKLAGLEFVGASDCAWTDNLVNSHQFVGISQSNKVPETRTYWAYNKVSACPGWGMQLQGETGGVDRQYFYRCAFTNMIGAKGPYPSDDGYGIRFNGNVHRVTFDECAITGNDRLGIQLGGGDIDQIVFTHCLIADNKGAAVSDPDKHQAMEWTDNIVQHNGDDKLPTNQPFGAPAPTAHLRGSASLIVGQKATFTDVSSIAPGAPAVTDRLWDFNEGCTATGAHAEHVFAKPGRYRVTVIVWDASGRGARAEQWVDVVPR